MLVACKTHICGRATLIGSLCSRVVYFKVTSRNITLLSPGGRDYWLLTRWWRTEHSRWNTNDQSSSICNIRILGPRSQCTLSPSNWEHGRRKDMYHLLRQILLAHRTGHCDLNVGIGRFLRCRQGEHPLVSCDILPMFSEWVGNSMQKRGGWIGSD